MSFELELSAGRQERHYCAAASSLDAEFVQVTRAPSFAASHWRINQCPIARRLASRSLRSNLTHSRLDAIGKLGSFVSLVWRAIRPDVCNPGGMYRETPSRVPGAVLWQQTVPESGLTHRVLPDGCMDLIAIDDVLVVAGPDTVAYVEESTPGARYAALRFPPGTGPSILGVPALELRDQRVPLADLWPRASVRRLSDRIASAPDPAKALDEAVAGLSRRTDPLIVEVAARLRGGATVAATAGAVHLGERQLHRRCLAAFGYGPKTLVRILRMNRALALARGGTPFASAAALSGYADQAHLSREVRALTGVPLGALMPPLLSA
jgi:AraC-like DNA-binding protein